MNRNDLPNILYDTLDQLGGKADIVSVCKYIWEHYQIQLEHSGNLFYTWQYDIRWAATELRKLGKMESAKVSSRGIWEINNRS